MIGATSFENVTRDCAEAGAATPGVTRTAISHTRSVSEKCERAPSRPAPPAKSGRNSQVVPREAQLLGAREALLRRAPREGGTDNPRGASSRMRQDTPAYRCPPVFGGRLLCATCSGS